MITQVWRILAVLLLSLGVAHAAEIKPLGFTLMQSSAREIQDRLGVSAPLTPHPAIQAWHSLAVTGSGLIPGSQSSIIFLFDQADRLRGLSVRLPKSMGHGLLSGYEQVKRQLSAQLDLMHEAHPTFGDAYALFSADNGLVQIEAPFLDLEMTISYFESSLAKAAMAKR